MLVFSRREGERIRVGDDIEITVVRVTPHSVRIGIVAPRTSVIMRKELVDRIADKRGEPKPQQDDVG